MSFTVCFVQCQQKLQLPHMNMPLFVPDLRGIGCEVECVCLHQSQIRLLPEILERRPIDLLGLEHMAPYGIIRRVKALSPRTRIVVGGNGFLDVFSKTDVDFAIAGAGRESLLSLVTALRDATPLEGVPNLFFKRREGREAVIDCSDRVTRLSLEGELRPYAPEVDWSYAGFRGDLPALGRRGAPPTIVADLGCPCRSVAPAEGRSDVALVSARYPLTEAARLRLSGIGDQRLAGGCSFCTYGAYAAAPIAQTVDLAMEQMTFLQGRYGFDRFCVGSEQPFRFLLPLLRRAIDEKLSLRQIRIRSRVEWILRFEHLLREAVEFARAHRFQLAVWQVGFESFSDRHLAIYSKQQTVRENLEAVRVLGDLERRYPGWFATSVPSHGFLGNTAWTQLDDIEEQMRNLEPLPRTWRRAMLGGPVKLFDELLSYAQRARQDGLMVCRKEGRNGFRFVDQRIRVIERGRKHYLRRTRTLTDAFFLRAAADAYWSALGRLVGELKKRDGTTVAVDRECRKIQRVIDRRLDPILKAHRRFEAGARREARGCLPAALDAYREARRIMPRNGAICVALSRTAQELGRASLAKGYARTAVRLLEGELEHSSEDPNVDMMLAQCLDRIGETSRAELHLRAGFLRRRAFIADDD